MALLWYSSDDDPEEWRPVFGRLAPDLELRPWHDGVRRDDVGAALVWLPPPGLLASFPNLKAVFSIAAGTDALLRDRTLPDVPVCRMMDPALKHGMAEYVLFQALKYHRRFDVHRDEQARRVWTWRRPLLPATSTIGVMGLGEIGGFVARSLAEYGFRVRGWSRSGGVVDKVETFKGADGLGPFLAELDMLVCLLPLTEATHNVLNADLFARLPEGARLIQVGRGPQLVVADLLAALQSGRLAHASLDVFPEEPLGEDSPLWAHPQIDITPHVASGTEPETAAAFVVENYRRLRDGRPLLGVVERTRGY